MAQYNLHNERTASIDFWCVAIYIVLVAGGLLSIYGATASADNFTWASLFDFATRPCRQLLWIALAGVIGFAVMKVDAKVYYGFAYGFYAIMVGLLVVTIFVAPEIKGSRSWLVLGPVSLQPAEFTKFATALALAHYMSRYDYNIRKVKDFLITGVIIFVPIACIILQKETGSALVYSIFILVLFREGMPSFFLMMFFWVIYMFVVLVKYGSTVYASGDTLGGLIGYGSVLAADVITVASKDADRRIWKIMAGVIVSSLGVVGLLRLCGLTGVKYEYALVADMVGALVFHIFYYFNGFRKLTHHVLLAVFVAFSAVYGVSVKYIFSDILQPHQQMRIKVTMGMEDDPYGAGYNVNQSKIAIGSGGLHGKGFLGGTQTKLKYVPEQDTDFIFCTVCEEFGFIGASAVVLLMLALILRLISLAERQTETFGRVYGYSVACILFFHLMINIGMVIGLTPVIGIPLPFFSYGGSSLWSFTILLFIFLNIDKERKL